MIKAQSHPPWGRPRITVVCLGVVTLFASVVPLLSACGGPSGGATAAAVATGASLTPVPSPLVTNGEPPSGAVQVVRAFWTLVGEGRLDEARRTLVAPGSPILRWSGGDIGAAHFVRAVPGSVGAVPADGATVEFSVDVWIEPSATGPNVWGDPREHRLFEHVVRMADGTWRMWDSGTGP